MFTPNEINLYSLKRLTADPDVTADDIWSAWAVDRYAGAAVDVVAALKPTFEAVNLAFFPVGFWVSDHSTLPSPAYAGESIPLRSTAKWRPDEPEWVELEEMLTAPDTTFIERLLAEKDRSISLSDESLDHLAQARLKLPSDDYEDLRTRLERLRRAAVVWRLHTEGLFVLRALKAGSEVAGAEERVRRAIEGLRIQAEFSREAAESEPPLPMERLEASARELERLLEEAKK